MRYFIHQGNALTFDLAVWSFNRRFLQNRLERCSCFEFSWMSIGARHRW